MSKADEMFKELGYEKIENHQEKELPKASEWKTQDNPYIQYLGKMDKDGVHYSMFIEFMTDSKLIQLGGSESGKNYQVFRNPILNLRDLQAINEKVKELGWNEVEIIEDEDINIQDIEELDKIMDYEDLSIYSIVDNNREKINDLIKAVKKLDKEINDEH